ncbi:hypothetical protein KY084_10135 [Stakelama sp. CBK3Z-3]|uniref:Uncharacterized protein n=1 Tax=Stakelama flava TaxID=2860338 RepID=A0ABS6XLY4_9SPHN|nr:hypothetical protein [Stakelama flava]MBW4331229.1 hypothetical protein [Stakelama flava]
MRALIILPALGLLAACGGDGSGEGGNGTSIAIRSSNDNGQTTIARADGNSGQMSLKLPGFEGKVKLPRIQLDSDDFDLDGVNLYPGSSVDSMNIDASAGALNEKKGLVHIGFTSPAPVATVRDWFTGKFENRGFDFRQDGDRITGTTSDGDRFDLRLSQAAAGRTHGELDIRG